MATKKIYLEYKYPEQPWKIYDWTQVKSWAETQENRMIREHPDAQHRKVSR